MDNRKASDVLLDLEAKIDLLINLVKSQDLNMKIFSNKLNALLESKRQDVAKEIDSNKPTISMVNVKPAVFNDDRVVFIEADSSKLEELSPEGFRRNSRPETYINQPVKPLQSQKDTKVQNKPAEAIVPSIEKNKGNKPIENKQVGPNVILDSIPVTQRVVDKNNKSIFLADIVVYDANDTLILKTRTNGAGKWTATLPLGSFKVKVRKRESLTKEQKEIEIPLDINGKISPLILPNLVFNF